MKTTPDTTLQQLERNLQACGVVKLSIAVKDGQYSAVARLRDGHSVASMHHASVNGAVQRVLGMAAQVAGSAGVS